MSVKIIGKTLSEEIKNSKDYSKVLKSIKNYGIETNYSMHIGKFLDYKDKVSKNRKITELMNKINKNMRDYIEVTEMFSYGAYLFLSSSYISELKDKESIKVSKKLEEIYISDIAGESFGELRNTMVCYELVHKGYELSFDYDIDHRDNNHNFFLIGKRWETEAEKELRQETYSLILELASFTKKLEKKKLREQDSEEYKTYLKLKKKFKGVNNE